MPDTYCVPSRTKQTGRMNDWPRFTDELNDIQDPIPRSWIDSGPAAPSICCWCCGGFFLDCGIQSASLGATISCVLAIVKSQLHRGDLDWRIDGYEKGRGGTGRVRRRSSRIGRRDEPSWPIQLCLVLCLCCVCAVLCCTEYGAVLCVCLLWQTRMTTSASDIRQVCGVQVRSSYAVK